MLPNKVIYSGNEYETIGFIKLNNGSFLILQNDNNIIALDLSKVNLNLNLPFEINTATKVETILIDYILESIKNDIKNGKYKNKEDLKKDIIDLNRYINMHSDLLSNMKQLDFKDEVVDKTIHELLSYFDEVMHDAPLNLEGITSFKVNGKSYIKYKDENNQVRVLDDNVDNRNSVEQFKAKQNESKYFKQENSKENALNIAKDMDKFEKTSVELEAVDGIIDQQVDLPTKAMQKYDEKQGKDIIGNVDTGVFYDENNDQILTAEKKDDKIVVSEVNEATHKEYNSGVASTEEQSIGIEYPTYDEETVTQYLIVNRNKNIDKFIKHYLKHFSIQQIDYILCNYQLTQDQITMLNEQKQILLSLKEEKEQKQKEKPKTKVLTLNPQKTPNAAFVDTLLLSFIVGLVSGMYLVFLILIIMS